MSVSELAVLQQLRGRCANFLFAGNRETQLPWRHLTSRNAFLAKFSDGDLPVVDASCKFEEHLSHSTTQFRVS